MNYDVHNDIENCKEQLLDEVRNRSDNLSNSHVRNSNNSVNGSGHNFGDDEIYETTSDEMETVYESHIQGRNKEDIGQDYLPTRSGSIPKVGQRVRYIPVDSDDWRVTTVLSRAGKATGIYSNWLNIQDDGCEPKSID